MCDSIHKPKLPISKLEEELIRARAKTLIKRLHFLTVQSHIIAFSTYTPITPKQARALQNYIESTFENIHKVYTYGTEVEIHTL